MTFPGRYDSLAKICQYAVESARKAGLNDEAVYAVELAVDEAATNIIEHAYGGEGKGDIQCTCNASHQGLTIIINDQGKPFTPPKQPEFTPKIRLRDLKARGAGMYLMRKMMDEVHYEYSPENGNTLIMVKLKHHDPKSSA